MDAPWLDSDNPTRPGVLQGAWRRSKRFGFFASFVGVPLIAVGLVGGLAFSAFLFGAGRGLGLAKLPLDLIRFGGGFILFWMFVGAAWGVVAGLLDRTRPNTPVGAGWSLANRPIPLLSRRRSRNANALDIVAELPSSRRMPVWPWLILVPLLMLLVVAGLAGRHVGNSLERRFEAAIAAADADDPNWRLDDLMAAREPVQDDENGAIVVARAVEQIPEGWPMRPSGPGRNPIETEASAAYDRIGKVDPNVLLDDEDADTLRAEMMRLEEALRTARTVADFERGRHELVLARNPLDTRLGETQNARNVARLLNVDVSVRAQDGDADGALDSSRALLGVARSIGDEPYLISGLVRIAIGTVAAQATTRTLGLGEPSDAALARLQAVALDETTQPLLLYAMRGERANMVEMIRRIRDGELPIGALSDSTPDDGPRIPEPVSGWSQFFYDLQLATGLEWMNEAVAIARRPPPTRPPLWTRWDAEIERTRKDWLRKWGAVLPVLFAPAVRAADSATLRHQATQGTLSLLLAAERHRIKHGAWPETLATIDPAILPEPPLDPFSGKPFLLNRRGGRFLVHSIGPNLHDEQGEYEPRKADRGGPDDFGFAAWDVPLRRQPAAE